MKVRTRWTSTLLAAFSVASGLVARAEVTLPALFGDSMVLQCDMPVPVWGWADPGEDISVVFAGQTKHTKADQDGRWLVKLDALAANSETTALTISGQNKITINNVLVGEVWICSGQSNMEWPISQSANSEEEIASANHPAIRLFNVPRHITAATPQEKGLGEWQVCSPETVPGFSAVGYFFGRRIQAELDKPVGLIGSNWGGTRIEPWTSLSGFRAVPELKEIAEQVSTAQAIAAKQEEEVAIERTEPSAIYNAMIHPLVPYAMRGAIWYQGESNGMEGMSYYHKKRALVAGWRKLFNPDLAFYWVQLANFKEPSENPAGGYGWSTIREAQRKALTIPHTGMAVTTDIGEAGDVHPRNKQDVGHRLAQWALHQTYGDENLTPSGPLYKSHTVERDSIRITFDYVGKGLMAGAKQGLNPTNEVADGSLEQFAIAGEDRQWHWAKAVIDGETVVVSSENVPNPAAVRYGYRMNPEGANLYNKDGLPASPFRTDNW